MGRYTTIRFRGTDEYILKLEKMSGRTREMCGEAIHDGAEIIADAVKSAINGLPTDDRYVRKGEMRKGPTSAQKEGLLRSFGISKMQDDLGEYNVKIGFNDYNAVVTKGWPFGQPNQMVARAVESGTSFMEKRPFVSPAVRGSRAAAEKKMEETLNKEIEKAMKG